MGCSKVLHAWIVLKSLICQRDPVGKSSGGGTPASFLYFDYRDDFHHLHVRLKGSGGNAERSCSTLLQIIPFCSPTLPVGRSQCRLISSPKMCLSLKGHGFPYWAGTQSNVSQVHIASESYCMYAPMMCRNASVGRRILLPEVFEGKPAVVVYEAFVSSLPLRRLCGVLIQAGSAYTRPRLLRCTFLSPTKQDKQKTEVSYCNITHTISSGVGGWIVFPCRTRRTRLAWRARPNLVVARSCFPGLTVLWTRSDRLRGPLLRSFRLFSFSEHFLALLFYSTFAICLCYGQF